MQTPWFELVGPARNVQLFGIKLLGVDAHNGRKLVFSVVFLMTVWVIRTVLLAVAKAVRTRESKTTVFWTGQGISLVTFALGLLGLMSIWFDNPARLATGVGLVGAGLAFALQKVITSFAAYFIILRGKTFSVGDRIAMGGVRGDVVLPELLPDRHHGDGAAALGRRCHKGHLGAVAAVFPVGSSPYRTPKSSTIRSTTTPEIFRSFGKRCTCPSPTRTIVPAPSRF